MAFKDTALAIGYALNKSKKYTDQIVTGSSVYRGTWNAETNTPTITQGVGTNGDYYNVSKGGTWKGTTFELYDTIKFNGSVWEKIDTHIDINEIKRSEQKAESYANLSQDKANQSENSAIQSGTYATQSGNYASDSMAYRDQVLGKFWQGDLEQYNKAVHDGIIRDDTIAFIMQEI